MRRRRGSVLLEGVLALGLLVPAVFLTVEWARRGWTETALFAASCSMARDVRWGLGETAAARRAAPVLRAALGDGGPAAVRRQSVPFVVHDGNGAEVRLHWRTPLLWRFRTDEGERHHSEVTVRCLSP